MKSTISTGPRLLALMIASASPFSMAMAQANAPGVGEVEAAADDRQIEDIIVTAQKRREVAQDVPISLQSFSANTLQQTGVESTEDLTALVGGILIQPTATRTSIYIRGIGTNASSTTDAVLTFIDGVYQPFGQAMDLGNVASVEVLKGPQGTLFGRNATGGVVQITTKPPSETPSARAEFGYGNYSTVDASAYATGKLAEGLAMDVSLRYNNQQDGFGQNVFNGEDVFYSQKSTVRSRLRYQMTDTASFTLAGDYMKTRGNVGTTVAPAFGYDQLFVDDAIRRRGDFFPGDYDVNAGPRTPAYRAKEWGVSGTLDVELDPFTIRSITAYRRASEAAIIDFDGGPTDILNLDIVRDPRRMFSQEIQLLSPSDSALQWAAGLFYYNMTQDVSPFSINTIVAFNRAKDESIAPYAQATYEILPETRLTLGGRYTIEKRSIAGFVQFDGAEIPGSRGKLAQKFKEPTWRIALDHKLSPTALIYGSVSRGFNAGYYNDSTFTGFATEAQNPRVLPEFLTAYEIGAKTDLFDRRLRLNASVFLYDYDGLQQQIYDQGAVKTINAGAARIKGIDLEIVAKPVSALTLSVSGTYLDTKYKSYELAPNYIVFPDGSVDVDPLTPNFDAAGRTITNSPKISYTATISHVLETEIGSFTTTANLNYRGKSYVDPLNRFELPKRYLLNITEQWTSVDTHLFATLWMKNVLNKRYDYAINILTPVGLAGNPAPPRTYGASLGFQF